jgi:DNA modification methylase
LKIVSVKLHDLKPYENNPRINDNAVDSVMNSIKEFGFKVPLVITKDNVIVAGHTRYKASLKLNLDEVPCIIADDLNDDQIKAFRLADNKVSEFAEWDFIKLEMELAEIDLDMSLFSFEELEIENEDGISEEDNFNVEENIPEEPTTKRGQLWKLGNHYLMCGDSTNKNDVEKLMQGNKADLVFTSPPYNINQKLYNDDYSDDLSSVEYIDFCKKALDICFEVTDGFIYWNVNYNANSRFEYIKQIENKVEYLIEQVCWKKSHSVPFKYSMKRDWEPIYVFSTNGKKLELKKTVSNLWEISNFNIQLKNHKACFPVELPSKAITITTKNNSIIFEPFGGSGTTLIACEQLNRQCYTMELSEQYCDVIIQRWETLTGKKAELI